MKTQKRRRKDVVIPDARQNHIPRHASPYLWAVIMPVVRGQIQSWLTAHPEAVPGQHTHLLEGLAKRLSNALTAPDVEKRLRQAIHLTRREEPRHG